MHTGGSWPREKQIMMKNVLIAASAAIAMVSPAAAQIAKLDVGEVEGATADGISSWKGIPYAKAPVDELRWRAPQSVEPWQEVRQATAFGNDCMQNEWEFDAAPLRTTPSEDCLYLNVWRPERTSAEDRLPVIVWIHGGGFVSGGTSPAIYDGAELARQGVILVSVNYRLGRFGFFAHPALSAANEDNGLLGNYGFLDQIEALRWVQRNVTSFGGDPNNVTIMGESAGGFSVQALMTSPMARGLFDKAIIMSGGGRRARGELPLSSNAGADAEEAGAEFAQWAGVQSENSTALAALRALPAEKVVDGVGLGLTPEAPATGPMLDGMVLVHPVQQVLGSGNAAAVPVMVGANTAENGAGPAIEGDLFTRIFDEGAPQARDAYADFGHDSEALLSAIYSDARMVEPARYIAQAMTRSGQVAWHYRAGYVPHTMREEWLTGLPHARDIPFFFRTLDAVFPGATTETDQAISNAMSAYFVNFAKAGNPNGDGLPTVARYNDAERPVLLFAPDGHISGADDPWRDRLDVVEILVDAES